MNGPGLITVITPTTGKNSIFQLMESLANQNIPHTHLILWDDKRDGYFQSNDVLSPFDVEDEAMYRRVNSIVIRGNVVQGIAAGSALRAVGIMAATTPYITFADDDVWFEPDHLFDLMNAVKEKKWAYCQRHIWSPHRDRYLGRDLFESVGNDSQLPYKLIDNSSLIVARRYASSAAVLYRETEDYNDDRLMFAFLDKHAGEPGKTNRTTVHQTCPERLVQFFEQNCTQPSYDEVAELVEMRCRYNGAVDRFLKRREVCK